MEYLLFFILIFIALIFFFIKGFFDHNKQQKAFKQKLYDDYGKISTKEYRDGEYEVISHYFLNHRGEDGYIDDITWNDLDMDRIFMLMNHTYSSAGAEYLYHMLRTPSMKEDELLELEKLISYFQNNHDERVRMQLHFAKLGTTGRFSLSDYLEYLVDLGHRSNLKHHIMNGLIFLSVITIPFSSMFSIVMMIGLLCVNMGFYYKDVAEIKPYLASFQYILRLLGRVGVIVKEEKSSILEPYLKELDNDFKKLNKFTKNSFITTSSASQMSASGNPLDFIIDYLKVMFHIDIIKFNTMLAELIKYEKEVDRMVTTLGFLEASISIGGFRASMPATCVPSFKSGIHYEEVYHPLINDAIPNSIQAEKGVLLTGSNASGKSTFLKTIAINSILAQTIHTCTAKQAVTDFYNIYSSMSLRDDLMAGESYYIVEIKSLKRILDAAHKKEETVLCFVDEVLRGTNTVERIAASTQILTSLAKPNIICFAATHDIELTLLLEEKYDNYHFTEEIKEGDILFNYKLLTGRATTRNAIQLLSMIGYDHEIIEKANKMAQEFIEIGIWK